MYKIIETPQLAKYANQICTFDNHGTPLVKKAFKNDIVASELDLNSLLPDMRNFIMSDFRPDPMFCYLIINALSDEETFGANVNGDAMPRYTRFKDPLLINETQTHGYKTYELMGHWFHHHKNRDPKFAAGFVLFSSYDTRQGIVRILVGIDRSKDPETCSEIDRGIMPLTSMGLKVPFDICSLCSKENGTREQVERWIHEWYCDSSLQKSYPSPGDYVLKYNSEHRDRYKRNIPGLSRWTTEYCNHLKYNMGVIDSSGYQIYAINHLPKLFDISKVFVNADKISQGIFKVAGERKPYASVGWDNLSGNRGALVEMGIKESSSIEKTASLSPLIDFIKSSEDVKVGAIDKESPAEDKAQVLREEDIQRIRENISPILDGMDNNDRQHPLPERVISSCHGRPLQKIMTTFCRMRIPPTPQEFQQIFLDGMGMGEQRRELDSRRMYFNNMNLPEDLLSRILSKIAPLLGNIFNNSGRPDPDLEDELAPFISQRSMFPTSYFPRMKKTIIMIKSGSMTTMLPPSPVNYEDFAESKATKNPSRNPFSLLETLAVAAAAYPFLRTALGKAIGSPQVFESIPPSYLATLIGGTGAAKMLIDDSEKEGGLQKAGAIAEYMPWSKNIGKAYLGSLAAIPGIHAYSLHQRRRAQRGENINSINRWIAMNPDVMSLAYFAGAPIAGRAMANKVPNFMKGGSDKLAPVVVHNQLVEKKGPIHKDTIGDKIINGATWGMMTPGRFLPSAMGGVLDTEIFKKILGQ